ncbi:MAG: type II secretion system F family protein [Betaproteobacteria bacterium]|nr:type II secretion system F family protein [Betaproteobacteria bacterium]
MTLYSYKAIDARGARRLGRVDAANLFELEQRLARMGLDLVDGAPSRATGRSLGGGVKSQELINFCFHLEQLVHAGVPIVESLADLRDSTDSPRLRDVVSGVIEAIEGGSSLSEGLAAFPETFGKVFVSLVRSGEQTGRLPEVLRSLTESLKWEDELVAQTRKAILYPAFAAALIVAMVFFLMIYLVPQLTAFLRGLGRDVPLQTRLLIMVSGVFVDYWWAILAAPFVAWGGLRFATKSNPALATEIDRRKLSLPLLGPILRKITLARFASSFALMYSSGITVLDALRSTEQIVGNRAMEQALRTAGQQIAEGKGLTAAFEDAQIFPPLVLRMLRVGENTGALDTALLNVSYFYNREVREAIAELQTLLGPVLILILGAVLFWVIVAVFGPLYDVLTKIKF